MSLNTTLTGRFSLELFLATHQIVQIIWVAEQVVQKMEKSESKGHEIIKKQTRFKFCVITE